MGRGFEIEYFSDLGTGPRYRVDAEHGFITRDEVFISGEGPLAESEESYPGSFEGMIDTETAEKAYRQILDSGLEPGEFFVSERNGERGFRVEVYGEESRPSDVEVEQDYINDVVEGLDEALR